MSEHPLQVSLAEKLDLIPAFVSISESLSIQYHFIGGVSVCRGEHFIDWFHCELVALAASYAAVEYPFRSSNKADTFYHHVIHALVRKVCNEKPEDEAQYSSLVGLTWRTLVLEATECPTSSVRF